MANFFGRFMEGFRAASSGQTISTAAELADYLTTYMAGTASGATVNTTTAMRVAAVYGCIRIISQGVAQLPKHLLKKEEKDGRQFHEKAIDHPVYKLFNMRPNQWQTSYEFWQMSVGHVCLTGNSYAYTPRSRGRVLELLPLHPHRVTVEQKDDLSLEYKYRHPNGKTITFKGGKGGEILHLRGLTTDGVVGLSPITAAREAIGLSLQTEKHGAKLFAQGAQLGGILKHPGPKALSPEAHANLKTDFEEKYASVDNAHKTILLEEGMDWTKVSMTSEDAQFLETRKFQRSEIAMFFGVPPHMLGDVDKTTSWGTGIEQQGIGFLQYTLQPWLVSIEQAIIRDLLTEEEEETLTPKFNVDGLLRGDFKTRQEGLAIQRRNGIINANEWRATDNRNPRKDEGGEEYITDLNMGNQNKDKPDEDNRN